MCLPEVLMPISLIDQTSLPYISSRVQYFVFSACCHVFYVSDVVFEQLCNNTSLPDLTQLLRFQQCHYVLSFPNSAYASTFQPRLTCPLLPYFASSSRVCYVSSFLSLCSASSDIPDSITHVHVSS